MINFFLKVVVVFFCFLKKQKSQLFTVDLIFCIPFKLMIAFFLRKKLNMEGPYIFMPDIQPILLFRTLSALSLSLSLFLSLYFAPRGFSQDF